MSFISRAFTLPGSTPAPLGSPANPIPTADAGAGAGAPTPAPLPPPPAPPPAPAQAATAPPGFQPTQTPAAQQRAIGQRTATSLLGAAAIGGPGGQLAEKRAKIG